MGEKYLGEKSVGEKSFGENRGRWDAGFRFPSSQVILFHHFVTVFQLHSIILFINIHSFPIMCPSFSHHPIDFPMFCFPYFCHFSQAKQRITQLGVSRKGEGLLEALACFSHGRGLGAEHQGEGMGRAVSPSFSLPKMTDGMDMSKAGWSGFSAVWRDFWRCETVWIFPAL